MNFDSNILNLRKNEEKMNYELEDSMLYENENRIWLIKLIINEITIQMCVT